MEKSMSPSEKVITAGQAGKFADVVIARLQKSELPHEPTQYVLENEAVEIAEIVEAEVRRRVDARIRATEPHILERQEFDPVKFLGKDWNIDEQLGRRTGNNLDAGQIIGKDYLKEDESYTAGEERLKRIKAAPDDIQLDVKDFMALWSEEGHATLKWLYDTKGIIFLSFWDTILQDPDGDRYVLCLCRRGDGFWSWSFDWLGGRWSAGLPASLPASSN